jgi:hypothetical protein
MNQPIFKLFCLSIAFLMLLVSTNAQSQTKPRDKRTGPIFVFQTDEFWLNLHHFLYVLGRAENKERDAAREAVARAPADQECGFEKLNVQEQAVWQEAVSSYAKGPSKKDLVFDDPLPAITNALAGAGNAKSLTGSEVDPAIAAVLQRAAPIYRKAWWKNHSQANRRWQKSIQVLVDSYGANVLAFITKAYTMEWRAAGFVVHVSGYSNWAGAYSTKGNLLVLSSQSTELQELYGFETIFHEGMHQWDDQVFEVLRAQAIKLNKFFPRGLDHALIFYTAGEAVRRVVREERARRVARRDAFRGGVNQQAPRAGVTPEAIRDKVIQSAPRAPEYVPYAERFGIWNRGLGSLKPALDEIWKPYLDGHGTRDAALAALITRTAIEPKKKQ